MLTSRNTRPRRILRRDSLPTLDERLFRCLLLERLPNARHLWSGIGRVDINLGRKVVNKTTDGINNPLQDESAESDSDVNSAPHLGKWQPRILKCPMYCSVLRKMQLSPCCFELPDLLHLVCRSCQY